jgi:hypothetical protein
MPTDWPCAKTSHGVDWEGPWRATPVRMADNIDADEWQQPAEDPLTGWERPDPEDIPEAIPEADSPEVGQVWEDSDPMEGPAPTG